MARGMVTAHPIMILTSTVPSMWWAAPMRRSANPTPTTHPIRMCDVDTGKPSALLPRTTTAAPICVPNDFDGVKALSLLPTVSIVRLPATKRANTHAHKTLCQHACQADKHGHVPRVFGLLWCSVGGHTAQCTSARRMSGTKHMNAEKAYRGARCPPQNRLRQGALPTTRCWVWI